MREIKPQKSSLVKEFKYSGTNVFKYVFAYPFNKETIAVYIDFKLCFQKSLSLVSPSVRNNGMAETMFNSVTITAATTTPC